jgi:hypothetical protein
VGLGVGADRHNALQWTSRLDRHERPGRACKDRFAPPQPFVASARANDASLHARAELDPDAFWAEQARELHWDEPFTTVLDDSNPPFYKWFVDGTLNVSYNCLDRHVEAGRGDRVAFHWAGEEGEQRAITYAELHREVQRFANALKELVVHPAISLSWVGVLLDGRKFLVEVFGEDGGRRWAWSSGSSCQKRIERSWSGSCVRRALRCGWLSVRGLCCAPRRA